MLPLNKLAVIQNQYQGTATKVLCVCSAGILRSPTLANILAQHGFNTRSCGAEPAYALIPISEELIAWADIIIMVHDDIDSEELESRTDGKTVIVMDIKDQYPYMDPKLIYTATKQLEALKLLNKPWDFNAWKKEKGFDK